MRHKFLNLIRIKLIFKFITEKIADTIIYMIRIQLTRIVRSKSFVAQKKKFAFICSRHYWGNSTKTKLEATFLGMSKSMMKEAGFSTESKRSSKFKVEPSVKLVSDKEARSLSSPGLAARVAANPFLLPLVPPINDTAPFIYLSFFS